MIRDARVLQPTFVPREVEHRNAEVNALSNALRPIMEDQPGETSLLLGPSGAGKTCIARYTVGRLRENVLDIDATYVNCWEDYTRFRALYRVLEGIDRSVDVHRQSTPTDELVDRLHRYDGREYVVVLDEVDQLEDERVLYDLHRTRSLTMILITNREEAVFADLDERLTSRLRSSVRIPFEGYTLGELVAILEARADWGLAEGAVDREQLAGMADAAAGDARVAIGVLRNAARRADQRGLGRITDDVVEAAIPDGRAAVRRKTVDQLTRHQRTLFEILQAEGELSSGDLYDRYAERVDDPKTKRTMRNYLTKMDRYDLVVADGDNRARTYRAQEVESAESAE